MAGTNSTVQYSTVPTTNQYLSGRNARIQTCDETYQCVA
jgi:hypothetical protein